MFLSWTAEQSKSFFYFNDIQFLNFYGSCFLVSIPPWHQENSPLAPCPKCFLCSFHKDFVALHLNHDTLWVAFLVAQVVKNPPAMWETWVWSLGWEDPLEEGMATHSSILAWRIPWTEEPGGLQFMGSWRAGHNWANKHAHFELIFVEDMRFCLGLCLFCLWMSNCYSIICWKEHFSPLDCFCNFVKNQLGIIVWVYN